MANNIHPNNLTVTLKSCKSIRELVWQIGDFFNLPQASGESLKSAEFETHGGEQKWHLEIFPKGADKASMVQRCVSTFLRRTKGDQAEKPERIEIGILHSIGRVWLKKRVKTSGPFVRNFAMRTLHGRLARGLLPNGNLTIVCYLHLPERVAVPEAVAGAPVPTCHYAESLYHMWESKIHTDCTLIGSDEKEFKAHRNILACQSPVFAAMFQDEMIEARSRRVNIRDIRGDVVEEMLRFIYTNTVPKLDAMAMELLAASEEYDIRRLKALCEQSLSNSLSVENACELFALADLHSAVQLKSEAIQFIKSHAKQVRNSDDWKSLSKDHVVQLFEAMTLHKE